MINPVTDVGILKEQGKKYQQERRKMIDSGKIDVHRLQFLDWAIRNTDRRLPREHS